MKEKLAKPRDGGGANDGVAKDDREGGQGDQEQDGETAEGTPHSPGMDVDGDQQVGGRRRGFRDGVRRTAHKVKEKLAKPRGGGSANDGVAEDNSEGGQGDQAKDGETAEEAPHSPGMDVEEEIHGGGDPVDMGMAGWGPAETGGGQGAGGGGGTGKSEGSGGGLVSDVFYRIFIIRICLSIRCAV